MKIVKIHDNQINWWQSDLKFSEGIGDLKEFNFSLMELNLGKPSKTCESTLPKNPIVFSQKHF